MEFSGEYAFNELDEKAQMFALQTLSATIKNSDFMSIKDCFDYAISSWLETKRKQGIIITENDYSISDDLRYGAINYISFNLYDFSQEYQNRLMTLLGSKRLYDRYLESVRNLTYDIEKEHINSTGIRDIKHKLKFDDKETVRVCASNVYLMDLLNDLTKTVKSQFNALIGNINRYINSLDFIFRYIEDNEIKFFKSGEIARY